MCEEQFGIRWREHSFHVPARSQRANDQLLFKMIAGLFEMRKHKPDPLAVRINRTADNSGMYSFGSL